MKKKDSEYKSKVIKTIVIALIILAISALLIYWYFFR